MNTSTGKLVLCPTPIGNLGDITLRTLDELRAADVVCAEDTRVTGKLLAHFDIEKRLERLDEATISKQADRIIQRVLAGERIAFCSDAGMPGVSDPGSRLVAAAQAADELLNIVGISTSFVLFPDGEQIIISGRSMGDTNVQVILEQLGGGGNAAAAGGQVAGKTLEQVAVELTQAIDRYLEEDS